MAETNETTETTTQIKYIDLSGLGVSTELIKTYVDKKDAESIKTVILNGTTLNFYRTNEPITEGAVPAYSISLPQQDISTLMHKISGTKGNIVTVGDNGEIADSEVAITNVALKEDVTKEIATAIANADHMKKVIVNGELPSGDDAKDNTFYLYKDENASGKDKYEVYTKINGELVLIDDTSVDLSGYYTSSVVDDKLASIKADAIKEATETASADATAKADQALTDAKAYTDQEVGKVNESVSTNTSDISSLKTDVSSLQETSTKYGDRISALENGIPELDIATKEDIQSLFSTILE
jgi:hypothetical protein